MHSSPVRHSSPVHHSSPVRCRVRRVRCGGVLSMCQLVGVCGVVGVAGVDALGATVKSVGTIPK